VNWGFGNKPFDAMIRISPGQWWCVNYSGVRLDSGDLNVIYERSLIHAEHGSAKKVRAPPEGG
jgi:hypothetical protein